MLSPVDFEERQLNLEKAGVYKSRGTAIVDPSRPFRTVILGKGILPL